MRRISLRQGAVVRLSNLDNLFNAFLKLRLDAGLTCNRMCIAAAFILNTSRRRRCHDFRCIFFRNVTACGNGVEIFLSSLNGCRHRLKNLALGSWRNRNLLVGRVREGLLDLPHRFSHARWRELIFRRYHAYKLGEGFRVPATLHHLLLRVDAIQCCGQRFCLVCLCEHKHEGPLVRAARDDLLWLEINLQEVGL